MREFLSITTALVLATIWACNVLLTGDVSAFAFVSGFAHRPHLPPAHSPSTRGLADSSRASQVLASSHEALGIKGLFGFGCGFGALLALARGAITSRRAEGSDIAVKQKEDLAKVAYLQNVPRSVIEQETLEKLLSITPREEWENPPERSYLYAVKTYAEAYGAGKATKIGWWDYVCMKYLLPGTDDLPTKKVSDEAQKIEDLRMAGKVNMEVPVAGGWIDTGALIQWKGKEPFAGDLVQTPVTDGRWSKQYIANMAFYREGLQPWQRGIEIGMAHGYFLIGPFVSLGPLRNTPEAATVGLLCGCAIVGIVSVGGLIFGTTIKPTRFDREGDKPAAGFIEMINWHALGGLGGAGFAHALLTLFGWVHATF
eukprot:TRINITY_DN964_c0_g1_i2.p1 TRINITY_DN964_c0_g1~~TRINITY_DN964_c0_g1_i2.p1  ORF type:complete len:370 (-),score=62.43 TRINITY_DN964_c0_g1_i2:256-1365(-)